MSLGPVLLIRPDGNDRDAVALGGQGIESWIEPVLEIGPPDDPTRPARLADELDSLGAGDWLLVTSPRTWSHWQRTAERLPERLAAAAERGVRVACVGASSAAALPALPAGRMLISGGISAEDLLAELLALPRPAGRRPRALLPASAQARGVLVDGLRAAGWQVDTAACYQTRPRQPDADSPIWGAGFSAVLVRSPSAADALAGLDLGLAEVTIFAVGPISAARCRALGWRVVELADTRSAQVAARVAEQLRQQFTEPNSTVGGIVSVQGRIVQRPRRLRQSAGIRRLVAETRLHPANLVLPLFVVEDLAAPRPVGSMPGVQQHSLDSLAAAGRAAAAAGIGGLMLFGIPAHKDAIGSAATDPEGILARGVRVLAEAAAGLPIIADLCLDEFTDHGHCGVLDAAGRVDNDATLQRYQQMAVLLAEAGATMVGASGMMDAQVGAVRAALDTAGYCDTLVLAYAAKYASAFYGPFREAVDSSLRGDRKSYQQDPANAREAHREVRLDIEEGADIVLVKPALGYLDVLAATAAEVDVPVAAYVVSGEYAMIEAAAANGWLDRRGAVLEALTSVRRAGAQIIVNYWATEVAEWLREGR